MIPISCHKQLITKLCLLEYSVSLFCLSKKNLQCGWLVEKNPPKSFCHSTALVLGVAICKGP